MRRTTGRARRETVGAKNPTGAATTELGGQITTSLFGWKASFPPTTAPWLMFSLNMMGIIALLLIVIVIAQFSPGWMGALGSSLFGAAVWTQRKYGGN